MANNLTRKDIAQLIGKSPQYIGVQIKRGHLIEKNKRIDTDNSKNKAFLSKFITKEIIKEQEKEEKEVSQKESDTYTGINQSNIDYIVKQHDLKLKIVKIEKERLDLDKKKGKLVEIDPVSEVMQRAVVVLSNKYIQQSKLFLIELAAKYEIPEGDIASLQKAFDSKMNEAVKESRGLIISECESVANEYSQTLNVGESKK